MVYLRLREMTDLGPRVSVLTSSSLASNKDWTYLEKNKFSQILGDKFSEPRELIIS